MKKVITALPNGPFKGYYWLSNGNGPQIIDGIFENEFLEKGIPFIVEAALFNEATNTSIFINHNGSKHEILQYDLNQREGYEYVEIAIETHRLAGANVARFIQIWREEPDALCAGMRTLKPFAQVFAGFGN